MNKAEGGYEKKSWTWEPDRERERDREREIAAAKNGKLQMLWKEIEALMLNLLLN